MFYAIHVIAGRIPATEIVFIRSIFTSVVLLPLIKRDLRRMTSPASLPLWLRAIAVEFSTVCFTWNLQHTSVGMANALYNTAPLLVLLAAWKTKVEKPSLSRLVDLLFIVVGDFVFWNGTLLHTGVSAAVWTVGLVGATAAASAGIALKRAVLTWNTYTIAWSMSIAGIPETLILRRDPWVVPDRFCILLLAAICLLSLSAQLLIAASFKRLQVSTASALTSTSILFGVSFEILRGEYPTPHGLIGCLLDIFGITRLSISSQQSPPRPGSMP